MAVVVCLRPCLAHRAEWAGKGDCNQPCSGQVVCVCESRLPSLARLCSGCRHGEAPVVLHWEGSIGIHHVLSPCKPFAVMHATFSWLAHFATPVHLTTPLNQEPIHNFLAPVALARACFSLLSTCLWPDIQTLADANLRYNHHVKVTKAVAWKSHIIDNSGPLR
jgi:hypothetical protein